MNPSKAALTFLIVLASNSLFGCVSVPRIPIPKTAPASPIEINVFAKLEPIAFEKGIITLTRGMEVGTGGVTLNYGGNNIEIERGEHSPLCTYRSNKIFWNTGSTQFSGQEGEFNDVFHNTMKAVGYDVVGDPKIVFDKDEEREQTIYRIAARVTNLKANICEMGHWWHGHPLGISAGEIYLAVEWVVYSTLARKTVLRVQTNGYHELEDAVPDAFAILLLGAFENAVKELAFSDKFYDLVLIR